MCKVTVIVPVYDIAPYLKKCLESIINQTLKDIEIILVDDGSTDGSGQICDEFAARDARIRVIHKQNEGLSCARNDGIEASTAPYLMFVDSDDWVDPHFCETPYKAAISNKAELVLFKCFHVKNGKPHRRDSNSPTGVVDAETAIRFGGSAAWRGLYRRELFAKIRFPAGRVYEEIAVTHKIKFEAKRIVMINDALYYYVFRKDSISHTQSAKNTCDAFISALQKADDLNKYGFADETYETMLCSRALSYLGRTSPSDDPLFKKAESIVDSVKHIPSGMTLKKKAMFIVWKTDRRLFHFICRMTGQKIEQKKSD